MKTLKRRTRSDKFSLTFHPTGQYCKKIKGKMYYFGSDKKRGATKISGSGNLSAWTSRAFTEASR